MGDFLTSDDIRNALEMGSGIPSTEPCVVLNANEWDDYKEAFNLTETQMKQWFVKATYIEYCG